jgi:conjugal transfer pilus assembly protein TraU
MTALFVRILTAFLMMLFMQKAAIALPAGVGKCTGHFVNPITDVGWGNMFPFSIGGLKIWPSSKPDTDNPDLPVCVCGSPIPRVGIAMGFWEPVRLGDVTMKPWCFVNLGGLKLDPGFDIGYKSFSGMNTGDTQNHGGEWNVHWYMYPLLYWLELAADFACLEKASIDILYVTEIDPLWQDDELTMLLNPEAILFANPIAIAACGADCIAATSKLPLDPLFWCAGCWGGMYPLNGNNTAQYSHVQGSRLALAKFSYKLHRQLIAWGTMGGKGLCGKYPMPVMRKQQYRFQAVNPVAKGKGRWGGPTIGASTALFDSGQMVPVIGEDIGYLVWRKRNCCAF